ncbi:MAG TPA: gamma-glutamyltransferase, partial [Xanthomonadales bacterium]|nr:gamma-glutamyltransferase [Xanthomonadales bacterium]
MSGLLSLAVTAFLLMTSAIAQAASFEPTWGRDGMVVTSVSPAAAAGKLILERGGNAADAAVATAFAAAVAHPFSSGLGGGLLAVIHDAKTGQSITLDARETAPASASAEFYLKNPDAIRSGRYSVAVPGFVQGVWALHERFGSLPWADLIEPAIALAENGVEVSVWHHNMVKAVAPALADYPATAHIQLVDDQPPPLGYMLKQYDLANTLRLIQRSGGQTLAIGAIAKMIEQSTKGVVTELDLARYKVKWREPIKTTYRGYEIVAMPPPSSGGVLLAEMFNVLQRYDLAAMGKDSSEYIHLVSSTMKLAFADRAQHLGDPDFHDVPVARLTSMAYADELAARIRPDGQPIVPKTLTSPPDDEGTTQVSVLDKHGNAVSITQTINTLFGSKITVPGTGIVLNNEMDDFSVDSTTANLWDAVGSDANAVAPGKRPLSSMTPLIVLKDGKASMALGSPMGTLIISAVLQTLLNTIDFGYDAQRAVMEPRFHHQWQPDTLFLEPEYSKDVRKALESLGHTLGERSMIGAAQLSLYDPETCYFWGGADG